MHSLFNLISNHSHLFNAFALGIGQRPVIPTQAPVEKFDVVAMGAVATEVKETGSNCRRSSVMYVAGSGNTGGPRRIPSVW
jgi:hypothetical protein